MYNPDRKNRFLNENYPNESTRATYKTTLASVKIFEEEKDKDICDFSLSEAVEVLIGLKKKTFKSLDVTQSILVKYIDWTIEEKYSKTFINSFKLIDKEDLQKYTHQIAQKNSYIDREKLFDVVGQLYNNIDKAIPLLFFEGVKGRSKGEHTFEELRNLRFRDLIPELNTIIVTRDDNTDRPVSVDPRTMKILIAASQETEYYKLNGQATGRFAVMPLKDTEYILRMIDTERGDNTKITANGINTRFKKFREWTGVHFLSPTTIFQSGMLERCESKEKQVGELTVEHYKQLYRDVNLDPKGYSALKEMYETYKKNKSPN